MRIPYIIGFSSLLLLTWLGLTFVREVPVNSYPEQEKRSLVLRMNESELNSVPN